MFQIGFFFPPHVGNLKDFLSDIYYGNLLELFGGKSHNIVGSLL